MIFNRRFGQGKPGDSAGPGQYDAHKADGIDGDGLYGLSMKSP